VDRLLYDRDIREPLFVFLEMEYGKSRILEEKSMAGSRADAVMICPDALYGIEIKSDADTYARLAKQVKDYDKYFDYNIVVVGSSHALHIKEHVPDYWGIITVELVDDTPDFYILRKPEKNPKSTIGRKLELLWRPELAYIQEANDLYKYAGKSKVYVIDYLAKLVPEKIDEESMHRQISERLFERDYNAIGEIIDEYRISHGAKKKRNNGTVRRIKKANRRRKKIQK